MKRRLEVRGISETLAICALLATLAPVTPVATAQEREDNISALWRWEAPGLDDRRVHLRFVRGNVRVFRRPGPLRVEIRRRAVNGYANDAEILFSDDARSLTFTDRYPRGSVWSHRESLPPPIDERGDYWRTIVIIEAVIWASPSTYVQVELMDGQAEGADRCTINSMIQCRERR